MSVWPFLKRIHVGSYWCESINGQKIWEISQKFRILESIKNRCIFLLITEIKGGIGPLIRCIAWFWNSNPDAFVHFPVEPVSCFQLNLTWTTCNVILDQRRQAAKHRSVSHPRVQNGLPCTAKRSQQGLLWGIWNEPPIITNELSCSFPDILKTGI